MLDPFGTGRPYTEIVLLLVLFLLAALCNAQDFSSSARAPIAIGKKLLWEQEKPILDAATVESTVIVLDSSSVSFYRDRQLTQSLPIPGWKPMPRDPRGRLVIERDTFRAFLPGIVCTG